MPDIHLLRQRDEPVCCLALYCYTAEPWEEFLVQAVRPFTKWATEQEMVGGYFFIRYWEHGPHIRLRFFGNAATLEEKIQPEAIAFFENYFRAHPSFRDERGWKNTDELMPNDSLLFTVYEPELERYGGPHCIAAAEAHFQHSSDAVLSAIAESEDWNYNRALGVAIQMHLAFAYAAGMQAAEARAFFEHIFQGWLPMAYYTAPGVSLEEITARKNETLRAFEQNFMQQKDVLVDFHEAIWESFEAGEEFEEEWMNTWLLQCKKTCARYEEELRRGRGEIEAPAGIHTLWYIYSSFIHMTNNRLGILNRDEGYLGYLIKESMGIKKP